MPHRCLVKYAQYFATAVKMRSLALETAKSLIALNTHNRILTQSLRMFAGTTRSAG